MMKKFASVLPTRMVHRKRSGFSRKRFRSFADFTPERASRRTRRRFSANTPASMPESRKDAPKQSADGQKIPLKERGRAKKKLMSERALRDLDEWLGGREAQAAE